MTITGFLLARIAGDEAAARAVEPLMIVSIMGGENRPETFGHSRHSFASEDGYPRTLGDRQAEAHFARHNPTHVLAECEAKRRIVELHEPSVERQREWHYLDEDDLFERWIDDEECVICGWSNTVDHGWQRSGPQPDATRATGCATLRILAVIYADHPDFDEAWRA